MRDIANASIDFTGVPHLLARPSKGEPNGVVVWSEIEPILTELEAKLDTAQLEAAQNAKLAATIKKFTLTGGVSAVQADPVDGEDYTFTTFTIETGFLDENGDPTTNFEDFAMSAVLSPWTNEGFRYEFKKEAPDKAVVIFQSIAGAFPNDRVTLSLIRIPSIGSGGPNEPEGELIQPGNYNSFVNDAFNHFGNQWVTDYVTNVTSVAGEQRINFKNGRWINKPIADGRLVIDWPDVDVVAKSSWSIQGQGTPDAAVVYQIQRLLLETGDSTDNSYDGVFDSDLTTALNAFKGRQNMPQNGSIDGPTWVALSNNNLPNWHV